MQQIGCGAEHIHNHGLVHGDIKPENVLMFRGEGGNFVPRPADFRTARGKSLLLYFQVDTVQFWDGIVIIPMPKCQALHRQSVATHIVRTRDHAVTLSHTLVALIKIFSR